MASLTPAGNRCLKAFLAAGALAAGGACAHNPAPAPSTMGGGAAKSSALPAARTASGAVRGGELVELVRNPQTSAGWLVYGKTTRRLIAVSDTVPDARGLFAVHFLGPK